MAPVLLPSIPAGARPTVWSEKDDEHKGPTRSAAGGAGVSLGARFERRAQFFARKACSGVGLLRGHARSGVGWVSSYKVGEKKFREERVHTFGGCRVKQFGSYKSIPASDDRSLEFLAPHT